MPDAQGPASPASPRVLVLAQIRSPGLGLSPGKAGFCRGAPERLQRGEEESGRRNGSVAAKLPQRPAAPRNLQARDNKHEERSDRNERLLAGQLGKELCCAQRCACDGEIIVTH